METLLASADPEALTRRLADLIDNRRTAAARTLMAAVRRLAPPSVRLIELSVRLAIEDRRFADGLAELDAALAAMPAEAGLHKSRAELRIHLDDAVGAAVDAAEAVTLDPQDPGAKAILGFAMLELGRVREATLCLREALAALPGNPGIRLGLAASQERSGDVAAARVTLADGVAMAPGRPDFRRASVLLCINEQNYAEGLRLAEAARAAGAVDARVLGLIGHCHASLGNHDAAGEAYAEALKLAPDDQYMRHLAAAAGRAPTPRRAAPDYVRMVYDGYGRGYEQHVLKRGYRTAGLIRAAVLDIAGAAQDAAAPATLGSVLDLGCGTGMVGVVLSDLPHSCLVGVDLSRGMLAVAETKHLYDALHEADIADFLAGDARAWQLILAADSLCYGGPLTDMLALIARRLEVGGVSIASIERLPESADQASLARGWALQASGRYAHTSGYLAQEAASAGLHVRRIDDVILREESDGLVRGFLIVLERCAG